MVSKQFTTLSMLLPVAMVIGTTISIYTYQHSYKLMTFMIYIFGLTLVVIFTLISLRK